ncbi:MAG: EAL domain-containing protein [Desulfobulbaceae bacterium]|nr:EAL domain-containing protein [Desulfobulbaceae bacterium]
MTLYRQLLIFTLVLFFLLFAGTWFAKLNSTRTFLLDQLESHAQDTATSLGLSISPHMEQNDLPAVETMFNAVFDRGYYRIIRLADVENRVLVDRVQEVAIEGVPQWFVNFVPLEAPSASSIVLSGWNQAGTVFVESHPGYAYKTLWETVVSTSLWFLAMFIVVLAGGGFGLRVLLKPLQRVEHQADILCKKQYEIQTELPRTRELRRVVEAMNRMTSKVRDMFDEQARVATRLRKNAYHDSLTGLGNRRYLEGQVATRLDRKESQINGAFLLVELYGLQELNQEKGFQAGDELVKRVGQVLGSSVVHVPHSALARLTGGNFGMFLPDIGVGEAGRIAETIVKGLAQLSVEGVTLSENVGHVGGVVYDRATELGQLLSGADTALRGAQLKGANKWSIDMLAAASDAAARGEKRWQDILRAALEEKNVFLFVQPVARCDDRSITVHLEVFSRIREDSGNLLSAGLFVPLAERLGLVASLDRVVLEKVMEGSVGHLETDRLSVNISPASLKDAVFRNWLLQALKKLPADGPRLTFEFAEFGAVQNLDLVREFGQEAQKLGHGYGLDHFGQSFANFGYLQSLRPDFVKIDRAYTNELLGRESDSHFFIGSLAGVAHSLDVMVVAEGVETEEQYNLLCELNLDAVQGYLIGRPEPFEPGNGKA